MRVFEGICSQRRTGRIPPEVRSFIIGQRTRHSRSTSHRAAAGSTSPTFYSCLLFPQTPFRERPRLLCPCTSESVRARRLYTHALAIAPLLAALSPRKIAEVPSSFLGVKVDKFQCGPADQTPLVIEFLRGMGHDLAGNVGHVVRPGRRGAAAGLQDLSHAIAPPLGRFANNLQPFVQREDLIDRLLGGLTAGSITGRALAPQNGRRGIRHVADLDDFFIAAAQDFDLLRLAGDFATVDRERLIFQRLDRDGLADPSPAYPC